MKGIILNIDNEKIRKDINEIMLELAMDYSMATCCSENKSVEDMAMELYIVAGTYDSPKLKWWNDKNNPKYRQI